jgi:hypothetical protein
MVVIGKEDEGMDLDWVAPLRPSEDSDDEGSEPVGRLEQKPSLNGPTGDLHQGATFRNEAKSSCHALEDVFARHDLANCKLGWHPEASRGIGWYLASIRQ